MGPHSPSRLLILSLSLAVLGFELSLILATPQALFPLVIFQVGPQIFLPRLALDNDSPSYASCVAGITGVHHHAWPFLFYFYSLVCFANV
jgi:hypothetical protein